MQSRLVQQQLHNPVHAEVVMEKLAGAQSLCASNSFVFVCTADGIVVAEHTKKRAIQVKSLKKPDLVNDLTKGGVAATDTVKELKERLNTLILQLKTRYASDQKCTNVLHLNKDITAFDAMCSASDDILLVSSNAQ